MSRDQIDDFSRASEVKPQAVADASSVQPRASKFGHNLIEPVLAASIRQALDGDYFVASTATPGTSIAVGIQTTFDATVGILDIYNTSGVDVILDYIRLIVETAGASATAMHVANFLDFIDRFTSGGTALTPKNVNGGSAKTAADVRVTFGANVVAAAGANQRRHSRAVARKKITVVNDEILFKFGTEQMVAGSGDETATVPKSIIVPLPPCIIPTGGSFVMNSWQPANASTAAKFEVEVGFHKR